MPEPARPIKLVVWGPTRSGKTMLLSQLVDLGDASLTDWRVRPADEATRASGEEKRRRISGDNHFLPPTREGKGVPLVYEFYRPSSGERFRLETDDQAGANFEDLGAEARASVAEADGLVLLFNGEDNTHELFQVLTNTLEKIHELVTDEDHALDPRPVAICLSKADTLLSSPADLRRARSPEGASAFVEDWILAQRAQRLMLKVEKHCANPRLFPVSAVGVQLHHGALEPVVFYDESLVPRVIPGATSINLIEPFLWVYEEVVARRLAAAETP